MGKMVLLNIPKCEIRFRVFIDRIGNVQCTSVQRTQHTTLDLNFIEKNILISKINPLNSLIKWEENHFKLFIVHVIANRKQATLSKSSSFQFYLFFTHGEMNNNIWLRHESTCLFRTLANDNFLRICLFFAIDYNLIFSTITCCFHQTKENRFSFRIYHRFNQWKCQQ